MTSPLKVTNGGRRYAGWRVGKLRRFSRDRKRLSTAEQPCERQKRDLRAFACRAGQREDNGLCDCVHPMELIIMRRPDPLGSCVQANYLMAS
jgi:hypothetical protein